jgi:prepilin-type N-terminal cleavage/methylation domain-containing protein
MSSGCKKNKGFSLLEVLIALVLFATFITAFYSSQSLTLLNSSDMREEHKLHELAQEIIQELKYNPPELSDSLTLTPKTHQFKGEGMENYEYSLKYMRLEIPNFSSFTGEENNENKSEEQSGANSAKTKKMFEQIQKYVKEKIWQIEITVKDKTTKNQFSLSTWIQDPKAKPELGF